MSRTLNLTLKKKWYDMILSGEKKEEYREIKPYWIKRLATHGYLIDNETDFIRYDKICFKNGYSKDAPCFTVECDGIKLGRAKSEWSDNWKGEVFIIKIGKIIQ